MTEEEYRDQHPEYDENEREHDCSLCRNLEKDKEKGIQWCGCEGGIDNCQFVPKPLSLEEALNVTDTYMTLDYNGLSQDEIDILDKAVELVFRAARKYAEEPERPKGEWVKVKEEIMSVDTVTIYKCSECERVIATLPSKLAKYYPFCHCGADMRGEKK